MNQVVNPPPQPKTLDYPGATAALVILALTVALLFASNRFDPSHGTLTISLLVVIAFIGTIVFSVLYTIPTDEVTSAVIGGLVSAFGAVIAYWLTRHNGPRPPSPGNE